MPSSLKYIVRLVLFVLLMGNVVSCQSWHEARAVVKEADSLLAKGVIIEDTVVLAEVIRTFDNPMGRIFAKEELVRAYYLMGRNLDDYHHNFSDAADFYIEADRLKTKDLILRGRINSCMGYLCKQDSCFKEALVFYERANDAFEKSGNERRIANGLLSIAEQYINLKQYDKADSVLAVAETYDIDSAYYADIIDVYGLSYFRQENYDSALVFLRSIKEYPRNLDMKCFNYMLILRCCNRIGDINRAIPYAEYIILHSNNAIYRSNAYYVLIQGAKISNNLDLLLMYSNLREDEDRLVQHMSELYAEATTKLKNHVVNPYPFRMGKIAIAVGSVLIIIVTLGCMIYRKKHKCLAIEKQRIEAELQEWKQHMREKLAIEEENTAAKRKMINDIIMNYAADFALNFSPDKNIWVKDKDLFRLADSSFGFVIYRLRDIYRDLNNRELKICITILLDFSQKQTAKAVCCAEDSVPNTKKRLAKKLGISPREIRDFLLDFIMQIA
ncbi:MAG: hypothetical protein IKW35_09955 [Paludibacteraceae bacterium]|nr:hypothetical protein [Paludibacteraceae bacterium]